MGYTEYEHQGSVKQPPREARTGEGRKGPEPDLFVLGLSHRHKALFIQSLGSGSRPLSGCLMAWRCLHSDMIPTCCEGRRYMLRALSSFSELRVKDWVLIGPPENLEWFRWLVTDGSRGLASH